MSQVAFVNDADGMRHSEKKKDRNDNYEHSHNFSILLVPQLHCSVVVMLHRIGFQCTSSETVHGKDDYTGYNR